MPLPLGEVPRRGGEGPLSVSKADSSPGGRARRIENTVSGIEEDRFSQEASDIVPHSEAYLCRKAHPPDKKDSTNHALFSHCEKEGQRADLCCSFFAERLLFM